MKKVIIASKNPVKINAVKSGFEKMFPDEVFVYEGISAASGVQDQPMSDEETLVGAKNRADHASRELSDADFWVGIEGGVQKKNEEMECFAWIVIRSKNGEIGKSRTGTFFLPYQAITLINKGIELGVANDRVFGSTDSKQGRGAVGILTDNMIDRTQYYTHAVILALIPFKNKAYYE